MIPERVSHLKLLLQSLPQSVQFVQTLTQVNVTVKLDEGSNEIRHAPLGFHLIPTARTEREDGRVVKRTSCEKRSEAEV